MRGTTSIGTTRRQGAGAWAGQRADDRQPRFPDWRLGAGVRQPVRGRANQRLGVEAVAAGRWSLRAGRAGAGRVRSQAPAAASLLAPGKFSHRPQAETGFPATALLERTTLCARPSPGYSGPTLTAATPGLAHARTTPQSSQPASHGSCLALQGLPNGACADRPSDSGRRDQVQPGWMVDATERRFDSALAQGPASRSRCNDRNNIPGQPRPVASHRPALRRMAAPHDLSGRATNTTQTGQAGMLAQK